MLRALTLRYVMYYGLILFELAGIYVLCLTFLSILAYRQSIFTYLRYMIMEIHLALLKSFIFHVR